MKIGLTNQNDKFGFVVVSGNSNQVMYDSMQHSNLTPFVQSGYNYAWEAQRDGTKLFNEYSHHFRYADQQDMEPRVVTEVSADEMLENHYIGIYDGVEDRVKSSMDEDEELREKAYNEIKIIIGELEIVVENLTEKDTKRKIKRVLMLFKQLRRRHFPEKEAEEIKKEQEAKEGEIAGPPPMPMPPATPGQMPLIASIVDHKSDNIKLDPETKYSLMEHYGERACEAIKERHKGAHYVFGGPDQDTIVICDGDNAPILSIGVNEQSNIDKILPIGKIKASSPYHTVEFYQRYWKPIVENIGHFYLDDASLLVLPGLAPLPDTPKGDGRSILKGLKTDSKKEGVVEVSFKGSNPSWFFEAAKVEKIAQNSQNHASKYTEQDYINSAIVKCVDPQLKSIHGRTGTVVQVIPNEDFIEVDVDFGRGIGIIRLTEKQLEIVRT